MFCETEQPRERALLYCGSGLVESHPSGRFSTDHLSWQGLIEMAATAVRFIFAAQTPRH